MPDSRLFLRDIREYADRLRQVAASYSRDQFEANWFVYQASLRAIEIIGEAVKNLPVDIRNLEPAIPWTKIARMRDIVAHRYFGIDNDAIWEVVSKQASVLREAVTEMLAVLDAEARDGTSGLS